MSTLDQTGKKNGTAAFARHLEERVVEEGKEEASLLVGITGEVAVVDELPPSTSRLFIPMDILSGEMVHVQITEEVMPGVHRCQLTSGSEAYLQVDPSWDKHIASTSSATAMNFSVEWEGGLIHLKIDTEKNGCLLLHPSATRGPFQVVELFGGLGGWSYSMEAFCRHPIAVVEHDRCVAEAYAKAKGCEILSPDSFLERALSGNVKSGVVVVGCVSNPKIWMAFGILNAAFGLASPPCQPWSGAGSETGLESEDGKIFEKVLRYAGRLHMRALLVENVPNIINHQDFPRLLAGAAIEGLTCRLDDVHSCCRAVPMYRNRWLATFVQSCIPFDHSVVQAATSVTLASEGLPLPGPSMSDANCLHLPHVWIDRNKLQPTSDALDFMSRSDMIPKWMEHKVDWTHETPVLHARTLTKLDKMCCIMARYGNQHKLPEELLKAKGLQTMLFKDGEHLRYFCPWEILSAMGFPPKVCVAFDLHEAFQQVGNAISPIHAWIQLARTHVLLGHLSMFDTEVKISEALKKIIAGAIKLSEYQPEIDMPFEILKPIVEEIMDTEDPPVKRQKQAETPEQIITPTVPFTVKPDKIEGFATAPLPQEPVFMLDTNDNGAIHDFCKGGIVFLKHCQKNWMMMVHGAVDESVNCLVQRALPHAKADHFESFTCRGITIAWDSSITCAPPATVTFQPCPYPIDCMMPNGDVVRFLGDVTWTIQTVLAFAAVRLECNVESLRLLYHDVTTIHSDFVAEYQKPCFQVRFKACKPGYLHACEDTSVSVPGMIPVHGNCFRFVAKHPASKLVRTACVSAPATIAKVVRTLFGDLCTSITWTVHIQGQPTDVETVITPRMNFTIEWDCFKPLLPTLVESAVYGLPADASQIQVKYHESPQRWIKSPFRAKACILKCDEKASIMQIAASFVSHAQLDMTMTCHLGARIINPTIALQDIPQDEVLSFKVAPLLGGGMTHGKITKDVSCVPRDPSRDHFMPVSTVSADTQCASHGQHVEYIEDMTRSMLPKHDDTIWCVQTSCCTDCDVDQRPVGASTSMTAKRECGLLPFKLPGDVYSEGTSSLCHCLAADPYEEPWKSEGCTQLDEFAIAHCTTCIADQQDTAMLTSRVRPVDVLPVERTNFEASNPRDMTEAVKLFLSWVFYGECGLLPFKLPLKVIVETKQRVHEANGECGLLPFKLPSDDCHNMLHFHTSNGECGLLPFKLPLDQKDGSVQQEYGAFGECGPLPFKLPSTCGQSSQGCTHIFSGECGRLPFKLPSEDTTLAKEHTSTGDNAHMQTTDHIQCENDGFRGADDHLSQAHECHNHPILIDQPLQGSFAACHTVNIQRWAAKHPFQKIVRIASLPNEATHEDILRSLFHDLHEFVPWTIPDTTKDSADHMPTSGHQPFDVMWGERTMITITVCPCSSHHEPAHVAGQASDEPVRWIKTPFTSKALLMQLRSDLTLAEVSGRVCDQKGACLSITCQIGGSLLDPTCRLADIDTASVLCLKIGPLCGGAKKAVDAIRAKVIKALESHGVFKDACADRAGAFLQKADVEAIAKHEGDQDDDFWKAIKQEANRVHFRLVYKNELQNLKKNERKKPPTKNAKKQKDNFGRDEFIANASNVIIDIKHFKDGDDPVDMLEASRFGPDQRGLTVMSLDEANRQSHSMSISVDALAILVIGKTFNADDEPFTMPAMTNKGQPIVIQAALRQYGDRPVTFKAAIPTAKVEGTASTVVEIHIFRAEVSSWKECSVPLHYMGVHIPAVRGSSLIATWAMKTWNDSRQPSPFREATYWHGFVRVPDDILDQVLSRSGQAGIYVSPRDDNRRHDDRFAVIAMPDCGLPEVLKKASSFERTLGIVRLRDQFGIRCRREHSAALRAALLPESAYVATEGVKADDTLWVLKNVPPTVGKEGLQDALIQSGWEAQPVRAQGQNRWLVASKAEPDTKHFCINGSFVLVEPIKRQRDANAVTITAKQVKVDTVMNAATGSMQIASSTRIQEVRAEISDQMEQKMQAANDRITQLTLAMEKMQSEQDQKDRETKNELAMVRTEQAFAKQKISEVEASVVQSGQTVIQTMQAMMSQMQASIETSMKQMLQGACCFNSSHDNAHQIDLPIEYDFKHSRRADEACQFACLNIHDRVLSDPKPWFKPACRMGEATNPGPLRIGTFNPHQLYNKEEVVAEWGPGLWTASETSHTIDAMRVSAARFKKLSLNSIWSPPVPKHTNNAGMMRGRASGTCIISHMQLKPYPSVMSEFLKLSSRATECLVDLGHGTNMYVASVYGPTHTNTFFDPWALLSSLCAEVFDHALAFKGPAVVMGDFNVEVEQIPRWNALKRRGWVDAAAFDATRRGTSPKPTSKDKARKSFILVNAQLVQSLLWCDTIEEHEFDAHPLLVADLNTDVAIQPITKWWLPASTDTFMFDDTSLNDCAATQILPIQERFHAALETNDGDEALRQFNMAFEACLQTACVDSVGEKAFLPKKCMGRCRKNVARRTRPSAPIIKQGRQGDFTPDICQTSMLIRDMTKQVRRLNSLEAQLHALHKKGPSQPSQPCNELWQAIIEARGFPPTFQQFVLSVFGVFVPLACPEVEYIHYLASLTKEHVQKVVAETNKNQRFARECRVLKDIQGGGSQAYMSVRDQAAPPFQAIFQDVSLNVVPQRWPKEGRTCLKVQGDTTCFDPSFPAYFQGQECMILQVVGQHIHLDRHVKWRDTQDLVLTQKRVIAEPAALHQTTAQAWSQMWLWDPIDDNEDNWSTALDGLRSLHDFPSLLFQPLDADEWRRQVRNVSRRSARGSCAYTPRELAIMPDPVLDMLLLFLTAIENGKFPWPRALMLARVVMLAKTQEQPVGPLQTRPITIASRIYRHWAKYRSAQIVNHLKWALPPQIAGTASGVSADLLSASLLWEIECALQNNSPKLGVTVDILKCYNMIPRIPVIRAMRRLGIPLQYTTALDSMFSQLRRLLDIAGTVGEPLQSSTGVPEGCAMSIIAMLSLTAWMADQIKLAIGAEHALVFAYADNWAVVTSTLNNLQTGLTTLAQTVNSWRMQISADKSWVWATHTQLRSQLGLLQLNGQSIPIKLVSEELGCDISYCRKVTKKTTQKRIDKSKRVMKRVAAKRLPKRFKAVMTKQLVGGIAGYGSELVYHTVSDLRVLRTTVCNGIGRSRAGNSPYLSTAVTPGVEDLAVVLLRRKLIFWRRFFRILPHHSANFLQLLSNGAHKTGATAFLRRTLADHGWKCLPYGVIQHERGWKINWTTCSKHVLRKLVDLGWSTVVCNNVKHRKHFDLEGFDNMAFQASLQGLDDTARSHALNLAAGKHVTNEALVHYSKGATSDQCPFCTNRDGRYHRVWECEHTHKFRMQHPELMKWLETQPEAVSTWGLLPLDLTWLDWTFFDDPVIPKVTCRHDHSEEVATVFTDGSAVGQNLVGLTFAAAAYVHCKDYRIISTCAEAMPGCDHSSYRGEVWAVIMALRDFCFVHVFTDCAAVVANSIAILSAIRAGTQPTFSDHDDLWDIVWQLLEGRPVGSLQITKVKAHQDIQSIVEPYERWLAFMNDKADRLAKRCLQSTFPGLVKEIQDACNQRDVDIRMLREFHVMWGEINDAAILAIKQKENPNATSGPLFQLVFDDSQAVNSNRGLNSIATTSPPPDSRHLDIAMSQVSDAETVPGELPERVDSCPHGTLVEDSQPQRALWMRPPPALAVPMPPAAAPVVPSADARPRRTYRSLRPHMQLLPQRAFTLPRSFLGPRAVPAEMQYVPVNDPVEGLSYMMCSYCKGDRIYRVFQNFLRHLESGECPSGQQELLRLRSESAGTHETPDALPLTHEAGSCGRGQGPAAEDSLETPEETPMETSFRCRRALLAELRLLQPKRYAEMAVDALGLLNRSIQDLLLLLHKAREDPELGRPAKSKVPTPALKAKVQRHPVEALADRLKGQGFELRPLFSFEECRSEACFVLRFVCLSGGLDTTLSFSFANPNCCPVKLLRLVPLPPAPPGAGTRSGPVKSPHSRASWFPWIWFEVWQTEDQI
eukprot:s1192_g2.t1